MAQKKMVISEDDTSQSLRERMMAEGPAFLEETLSNLDRLTPAPQDALAVTYAPKLTKELGRIDWKKPAEDIHRLVRGLLPWPAAYTFWEDKQLKLLKTSVTDSVGLPGEVLAVDQDGLLVGCGQGALLAREVHYEASKPMTAHAFAIGHGIARGAMVGDRS